MLLKGCVVTIPLYCHYTVSVVLNHLKNYFSDNTICYNIFWESVLCHKIWFHNRPYVSAEDIHIKARFIFPAAEPGLLVLHFYACLEN